MLETKEKGFFEAREMSFGASHTFFTLDVLSTLDVSFATSSNSIDSLSLLSLSPRKTSYI